MTWPAVRWAAHRPRRTDAVVLAGFLLLSTAIFAPADLHPAATVIGATIADPSQQAWFLGWLPYAIAHHVNPLFSTSVISQTGVNMMWNTWIPLPALLLSPLTLLAGPVAGFDAAVTLGVALSGWCMYLAASRFVRRIGAAVLAGAAYCFSPFMFDQAYAGHSNMVIALVPPLMLLAVDTILVRQNVSSRRAGLLFGTLMTAQFFITEELLASEAVVVAVAVGWVAIAGRRHLAARWRFAARSLGWALLLFLPLVAYPIWFQFLGPAVPVRVIGDKNFFVTDLVNILLPSTAQGVEPGFAHDIALRYSGNSGEWGGYLGLPMLAVIAWTAWREWRRPLVRVSCAVAGTVLIISLGSTLHVAGIDTHVPLPGLVLAHIPVLDNLLPARFALYVALLTALLFGVFVDSLPPGRRSAQIVAFCSVAIALAFLPPLPFPTRPAVTPAYFTASPPLIEPGSTLLVVPFAHDFYSTEAMLWQAEAGISFSMPEGYIINRQPSGVAGQGPPPSATSITLDGISSGAVGATRVAPAQRAQMLNELRAWHVSGVVLGPMDRRQAMLQFLTLLLGPPSSQQSAVTVWVVRPG